MKLGMVTLVIALIVAGIFVGGSAQDSAGMWRSIARIEKDMNDLRRGNLCPNSMWNGGSFCIDKAPSEGLVGWAEAVQQCQGQRKRLCTPEEYYVACMSSKGAVTGPLHAEWLTNVHFFPAVSDALTCDVENEVALESAPISPQYQNNFRCCR